MATSKVWPSTGSTNVTSTSYSIPQAGNVNWASLTDFLVALANGSQATTFQRFALRVATSTPVTVSANDCVVQTNLTVPGAVAVTLPAGVQKIIYFISDGKGDAGTNNITITPNPGETIAGQATYVIDTNSAGVMLAFQSSDNDWKVVLEATPNGTVTPSSITLANGDILIGNVSNVAQARTMSGDITISNTGVTAIGTGVIVNADIDAAAAIDYSKLATLTAGNLVLGSAGNVATSTAMSGDITINSSGVTAIGSGVIVNGDINASAAIDVSKLAALTASRAVVTDASGFISAATTTATEIGYVNGVTSSIQTQLNAKASTSLTSAHIYVGNGSNIATDVAMSGDITINNTGVTAIGSGVIVNADVNASAAIAGTKISPDFGSQNVATTGVYSGGATTITTPGIYNAKNATTILGYYVESTGADSNVTGLAMKNDARDWRIQCRGDTSDDFAITDNTAGAFRLRINSSGVVTFSTYTTGVAHFDSSGVITSSTIVNADVSSSAAIAGSKINATPPTVQFFTSGTAATYTTPAGCKWIQVEMVGGGGGGGCSGTAAGTPATAGGSSIWATSGAVSIITCSGGGAGVFGNTPGAAGTVTAGSGYIGGTLFNSQRGGGAAGGTGSATIGPAGGDGGSTPFGGGGAGGTLNQAGLAAAASTGSGGGGAGLGGSGTNFTGSGGSAGAYAKFYITSLAASYLYTIGAAGTGGTAGTNGFAGGNGAAGFIQVTEFYI